MQNSRLPVSGDLEHTLFNERSCFLGFAETYAVIARTEDSVVAAELCKELGYTFLFRIQSPDAEECINDVSQRAKQGSRGGMTRESSTQKFYEHLIAIFLVLY